MEESLIVALEVGEDLDHPVDHASTQSRSNSVFEKAVFSVVFHFELAHIIRDGHTILSVHIDVLPLDVVCLLSRKVQ